MIDYSELKELAMACGFSHVGDLDADTIEIHPEASFRVRTAGLLKRSLKEIHALGGDYVSVLLSKGGESEPVLAAKRKAG